MFSASLSHKILLKIKFHVFKALELILGVGAYLMLPQNKFILHEIAISLLGLQHYNEHENHYFIWSASKFRH